MTQNGLARPTKVSATADKQVMDAAANRDSAIDTDGVVGCARGQNLFTDDPQHKKKEHFEKQPVVESSNCSTGDGINNSKTFQ